MHMVHMEAAVGTQWLMDGDSPDPSAMSSEPRCMGSLFFWRIAPLIAAPHQRVLVVHPVLRHARRRAERLDGAQVRRELPDLRVELLDEGVELFGPRLCDRVPVVVL